MWAGVIWRWEVDRDACFWKKNIVSLRHRLLAFKGAARQRIYSIGVIFKGLTRTCAPVVKNVLLNLGKQALKSGIQALDDISRGEDVKLVIKRRAVEGVKRMGKKSINRAPTGKTIRHKQTVTGSRKLPQIRRKEYLGIFFFLNEYEQ